MKKVSRPNSKHIIGAAVTTALVTGAQTAHADSEAQFFDVSDQYFSYEAIHFLTKTGIINGFEDGSFQPDAELTRSQTAELLTRALDLSLEEQNENPFKDVSDSNRFYDGMVAAYQNGIMLGAEDGTYRPDDFISREELATVLARAFELKADKNGEEYDDMEDVSSSHKKDVMTLNKMGIIRGYGDQTFRPTESVTRGQLAAFLSRSLNTLPQPKPIQRVENGKVLVGGTFYEANKELLPFFSKDNQAALDASKIHFNTNGDIIEKITYLEIQDTPSYDGKSIKVDGPVKVNGAVTEVKNIQTSGDLNFSDKAQDINLHNVNVEGTANWKASENAKLNLVNSHIKTLLSDTKNTNISLKGLSVTDLIHNKANAKIENLTDIPVKALKATDRLRALSLFGDFEQVEISNKRDLQLGGEGGIKKLVNQNPHTLELKFKGNLEELNHQHSGKVKLGKDTTINELALSENIKASDVFLDIDEVKDQIQSDLGLDVDESSNTKSKSNSGGTSTPSYDDDDDSEDNSQDNEDDSDNRDTTAPGKVSNLSVTPDLKKVDISWDKSQADDFDRYELFYIKGNDVTRNTSNAQKKTITNIDTNSLELTNLESGQYAFAIYAIDQTGNYSEVAKAQANVTNTITTSEDPFNNNQTYDVNYEISLSNDGVYGAETLGNEATINGDVTLKGDINGSSTLQNVKVNGTVYVDPGDDGSVTLENVTANNIVVRSGKKGTINLNYIDTDNMKVEDGNGVRLLSNGQNKIKEMDIDPEEYSSTETDVVLEGSYNDTTIKLKKPTKLTANTGFSAKNIDVEVEKDENTGSNEVKMTGDFKDVESVNIKKSATITADENANIEQVNIDIADTEEDKSVEVKGNGLKKAKVNIKKETDLKVNGEINEIEADANVTLDGDQVSKIKKVKASEKAKVQSANDAVESALNTIKQQSIQDAIAKIKEIEAIETLSKDEVSLVEAAQDLVDTAKAYGAKPESFVQEETDYLAVLEAASTQIQELLQAKKAFQDILKLLPSNPANVYFDDIDSVQPRIQAANSLADDLRTNYGYTQEDLTQFEGYNAIEELTTRISQLENQQNQAKTNWEETFAELPSLEDITLETVESDVEELEKVKEAYAQAKWNEVDVTQNQEDAIEKVSEKVYPLQELKQSLDKANQSLNNFTEPETIQKSNYETVKEQINQIKEDIDQAKANGADDDQFDGLDKYENTLEKIKEYEKVYENLTQTLKEQVESLPATEEVNYENLQETTATLTEIEKTVEDLVDLGYDDTELEGYETITAIQEVVETLEQDQTTAVQNVNQAISDLNVPTEDLKKSTYETLLKDVENIKELIKIAEEKGATSETFEDLSTYTESKLLVETFTEEKDSLFETYSNQMRKIPEQTTITYTNMVTVEANINKVKETIEELKDLGYVQDDLNNTKKLENASSKIAQLKQEQTKALEDANVALENLTSAEEVNDSNAASVRKAAIQASELVDSAKEKGVKDSQFSKLDNLNKVLIKLEQFAGSLEEAIQGARDALKKLHNALNGENYNEIVYLEAYYAVEKANKLGATADDYSDLKEEWEAYTQLNDLGVSNFLSNDYYIEDENNAASVAALNEKLSNEETISLELLKAASRYYVDESKVSKYVSALQSIYNINPPLTDRDIAEIVSSVNNREDELLIQKWNQNIEDITYNEARSIYHFDQALWDEIKPAIINKRSDGMLTEYQVRDVIESVFNSTVGSKMINSPEKIEAYDVERYIGHEQTVYDDYLPTILNEVAALSEITPTNVEDIVKTVNQSKEEEIVNEINANLPNIEDLHLNLEGWRLSAVPSELIQKLIDKKLEKGMLDLSDIQDELNKIKQETALRTINEDMDNISDRGIRALVDVSYNSVYYNLPAIKAALKESNQKPITLSGAQKIITNVVIQEDLVKQIQNNIDNISFGVLRDLVYDVEVAYFEDYVTALQKESSLSEDKIEEIVEEINSQKVIERLNEDPSTVSYQELRNIQWFPDSQYDELIKLIKETSDEITKEKVIQLIENVEEQVKQESLQNIWDNKDSFTKEDLENARVYFEDKYLEAYHQYFPQFLTKGDNGVFESRDVSQAVHEVHQKLAYDKVTLTPDVMTLNDLDEVVYSTLVEELMPKYKADIKELLTTNDSPTNHELTEVVEGTNQNNQDVLVNLVNDQPGNVSVKLLRFFDGRADYDYEDDYRAALVAEEEALTVEKIVSLIQQVTLNKVVQEINEAPSNFEGYQLRKVVDGVHHDLYEEYKNEIVNHENFGELTIEDLEKIVAQYNVTYLMNLNDDQDFRNDLGNMLEDYSIVRESLFDQYKEALENQKENIVSAEDLSQLVKDVNQATFEFVVTEINKDPITVSEETLEMFSDLSEEYYYNSSNLAYYQQALQVKFEEKGEALTFSEMEAVLDDAVNYVREHYLTLLQDKISNDNLDDITFTMLSFGVKGYPDVYENQLDLYIQKFKDTLNQGNSLETLDHIRDAVRDVNDAQEEILFADLVEKLKTDSTSVTHSMLNRLYSNAKEDLLDQYITTITTLDLDQGKDFLDSRIYEAIIYVNEVDLAEQVSNDPYNSQEWLYDMDDVYITWHQHMDSYYSALDTAVNEKGEALSPSEVVQVVQNVNIQYSMPYILDNPDTFENRYVNNLLLHVSVYNAHLPYMHEIVSEKLSTVNNDDVTQDLLTEWLMEGYTEGELNDSLQNNYGFPGGLAENTLGDIYDSYYNSTYRSAWYDYNEENDSITIEGFENLIKETNIGIVVEAFGGYNFMQDHFLLLQKSLPSQYEGLYQSEKYNEYVDAIKQITGSLTKEAIITAMKEVNGEDVGNQDISIITENIDSFTIDQLNEVLGTELDLLDQEIRTNVLRRALQWRVDHSDQEFTKEDLNTVVTTVLDQYDPFMNHLYENKIDETIKLKSDDRTLNYTAEFQYPLDGAEVEVYIADDQGNMLAEANTILMDSIVSVDLDVPEDVSDGAYHLNMHVPLMQMVSPNPYFIGEVTPQVSADDEANVIENITEDMEYRIIENGVPGEWNQHSWQNETQFTGEQTVEVRYTPLDYSDATYHIVTLDFTEETQEEPTDEEPTTEYPSADERYDEYIFDYYFIPGGLEIVKPQYVDEYDTYSVVVSNEEFDFVQAEGLPTYTDDFAMVNYNGEQNVTIVYYQDGQAVEAFSRKNIDEAYQVKQQLSDVAFNQYYLKSGIQVSDLDGLEAEINNLGTDNPKQFEFSHQYAALQEQLQYPELRKIVDQLYTLSEVVNPGSPIEFWRFKESTTDTQLLDVLEQTQELGIDAPITIDSIFERLEAVQGSDSTDETEELTTEPSLADQIGQQIYEDIIETVDPDTGRFALFEHVTSAMILDIEDQINSLPEDEPVKDSLLSDIKVIKETFYGSELNEEIQNYDQDVSVSGTVAAGEDITNIVIDPIDDTMVNTNIQIDINEAADINSNSNLFTVDYANDSVTLKQQNVTEEVMQEIIPLTFSWEGKSQSFDVIVQVQPVTEQTSDLEKEFDQLRENVNDLYQTNGLLDASVDTGYLDQLEATALDPKFDTDEFQSSLEDILFELDMAYELLKTEYSHAYTLVNSLFQEEETSDGEVYHTSTIKEGLVIQEIEEAREAVKPLADDSILKPILTERINDAETQLNSVTTN